jgi:hypothetical protein
MKRPHKNRTKRQPKRDANKQPLQFPKTQNSAKPQGEREEKPPLKYSPQTGLPANEKLRKFADEIYGDMEIPFRKHN